MTESPTWFFTQISAPSAGTPAGVVEEGYFVIDNGHVQLTNSDGRPLPGDAMRAPLKAGEGGRAVASRLLKAAKLNQRSNFHRPIRYGEWKF
jgi:hypothetical protein